MGIPLGVGYMEAFVPKLFIHALHLLAFIRALISSLFRVLGLSDFLEPDQFPPEPPRRASDRPSLSAFLFRELLPVTRFVGGEDSAECCTVCLYEFEEGEEIRRLGNCGHVFHRSCLDRWMGCGQMTCPLCWTRFVPDGLEEELSQRLRDASVVATNGEESNFYWHSGRSTVEAIIPYR